MGILTRALSAYGGIYNLIFFVLFCFLALFFVSWIRAGRFLHAFYTMLFMFPTMARIPLRATFYIDSARLRPTSAAIGIHNLVVLYFWWQIRSEPEYKTVVAFLKRKKILVLILIASLSMAISQAIGLSLVPGLGIAFIKVLEPFLFMVIVAFLVYKYSDRIGALVTWMIFSILHAALFTVLTIEQVNIEAALVRFGNGPLGSPTMAAAISMTWAIVGIANWFGQKLPIKVWSIAGAGLLVSIGILTYTRGPLVYFLIGVLVLLFFVGLKRAFPLIIVVVPLLLAVSMNADVIVERVLRRPLPSLLRLGEDANWVGRRMRNSKALDLFLQSPLIGIPIGKFEAGPGPAYDEVFYHIYNTPLAWLTYGGLFCGVAFSLLNIKTFFMAINQIRRGLDPGLWFPLIGFAIALLCWFLDFFATANNLLWGYPFTAVVYFYAIPGYILGLVIATSEESTPVTSIVVD